MRVPDGVGATRDRARERASRGLRSRVDELRHGGWPILQTALAAAGAWLAARYVLGHEAPVFAAISAIICLGTTLGERRQRAVEMVLGVALGIAVADLLVRQFGSGTLQLAVLVVLAMVAALLVGGGGMLATQAAVSAVLVAALPAAGGADRFLDSIAGGVVALAVNAVLPVNPLRRVQTTARPLFEDLADALDTVAEALAEGDSGRAEGALLKARALDERVAAAREAVAVGRETARFAPPRRGSIPPLERYGQALVQVDLAARNTRVLARNTLRFVRGGRPAPPALVESVVDLARAVRTLGAQLEQTDRLSDARPPALRATKAATRLLEDRSDLAASAVVSQIYSTAVDLLRASGLDREAALRALRSAQR
jgi:uncharacterized membrane protein YgaE (UPF0421/DUF939 family)